MKPRIFAVAFWFSEPDPAPNAPAPRITKPPRRRKTRSSPRQLELPLLPSEPSNTPRKP